MKSYIKPVLECVELRAEERLANCNDVGACTREVILAFNMQSLS